MKNNPNPALEKRARVMFENARRGAQLFVQWYSLTENQRDGWRSKANEIEKTIQEGLAKKKETTVEEA